MAGGMGGALGKRCIFDVANFLFGKQKQKFPVWVKEDTKYDVNFLTSSIETGGWC